MRARHHLQFLLRRGITYTTGKHWTGAHRAWVKQLRFGEAAEQIVFDERLAGARLPKSNATAHRDR